MKKGLVFLLAASTLFGLGFMGQTEKVEAETTKSFVKVTEAPTSWDGTYLIVYEAGEVAFNGALTTLDAVSNTLPVTISNNEIAYTDTLNAATFTIEGSYLKSSSGYYVGQTSDANGLKSNKTTTYDNTFTINSDDSVNIASGGAYLRYNSASNQLRFRYYKSSSYSGQNAIHLYKLNEGTGGDVEEPVEKTPTEEVNELLTSYYNYGSYQRDTVINLNEAAQLELISCFHAQVNLLERTTYFVDDQLWMSNEEDTYSYYGTRGEDMTSGRSSEAFVQPKSIHIAQKGVTMEGKYTTMNDIKANEAEWTKIGEVYSTNDPAVIQMFLDFTAPCFLGLSDDKANYFSLDHVEVEQKGETLELRLVTTGDQGKLTDANGVLSVATITKGSYGDKIVVTNIADVLTTDNGTKVDVTGKVVRMYNSTNSFYIADEKGNELLVYQTKLGSVGINDIVNIVGKKEYVNEAPRIAKDSTGTLIENNEYTPEEISKTLAEAYEIANGLDKNVVSNEKYQVTGTVVIKENKYYLTDGTKEMQLYGGDNSELHDGYTVTVLGNVTKYSSTTLEFVNYSLSNIIPCNYSVTINNSTNGSVQASVSENLPYGTEVTLTIEADTGYVIDSLFVNNEIVTVSNNTYTFNIEKDTTVSATFKNNAVQTEEETLAIKGTTGTLSGDSTSISWSGTNFTLTNEKGSSSTAIRTSDSDHFRSYVGNKMTVSGKDGATITKVEITCVSSYVLQAVDVKGASVSFSGTTVTITNITEDFVINTSKQWRLNSIKVTYTK